MERTDNQQATLTRVTATHVLARQCLRPCVIASTTIRQFVGALHKLYGLNFLETGSRPHKAEIHNYLNNMAKFMTKHIIYFNSTQRPWRLVGEITLRGFSSKKNNQSRNLRGHALAEYKKTIKLNSMQKEVLVGTLLGDACLGIQYGKPKLSVKFEQKITRADYIHHLHDIFENFVGTPPQVRDIRGGGAQDRQSIWFRTYGHPEFQFYNDLFYPIDEHKLRKKRIPQNIGKFLTPRALAYWFMDDGTYNSKSKNNSNSRTYVFSTQSFPLEDQELLVQALINNFSIHVNIQKDRSMYKLYIPVTSTVPFLQEIRPYIHPCFDYKIK